MEYCTTNNPARYTKRTFYASSIGFAIYVGAYFSLQGLQSSINVKNDLGPKSVFLCFAFSIFGIFTTPFALKRYGEKTTLIAGELFSLFSTFANFYPRWYTMFPTAIVDALTSTNWTWSASAVVINKIATVEAESKDKDIGVESQKHFGKYLGIIALGQVLSNIVTKLILTYVKSNTVNSTNQLGVNYNQSALSDKDNFHNISIDQCGSRDCPSEYAYGTSDKLARFEPDQFALHVLLAVFAFMQISAATVHWIVLPPKIETQEMTERNDASDDMPSLKNNKPKCSPSKIISSLKEAVKNALTLQSLLTMPLYLLYGLTMTFAWSELNRAYVSCVVGVDQVGTCSALIDFFSFLTSFAISKCATKFGLTYILIFALIYDLTYYIVILLWIPTRNTTYLTYVFASTFGVIHATRRNTVYTIVSTVSKDKDIGFSTLIVVTAIGSMLTFSWTTVFCVYIKIYIMMGFVILSTALWALSNNFTHNE